MAQDGLEFRRIGTQGITQVNFVMLPVHEVALFLGKGIHPGNRGGFCGIWTEVHDLDAQAFVKRLEMQAFYGWAGFFLAELVDSLDEKFLWR